MMGLRAADALSESKICTVLRLSVKIATREGRGRSDGVSAMAEATQSSSSQKIESSPISKSEK
jgi:hypothetical protein